MNRAKFEAILKQFEESTITKEQFTKKIREELKEKVFPVAFTFETSVGNDKQYQTAMRTVNASSPEEAIGIAFKEMPLVQGGNRLVSFNTLNNDNTGI